MNCATTPRERLTNAVRLAFEQAAQDRVSANRGHANSGNIAGWDTIITEKCGASIGAVDGMGLMQMGPHLAG